MTVYCIWFTVASTIGDKGLYRHEQPKSTHTHIWFTVGGKGSYRCKQPQSTHTHIWFTVTSTKGKGSYRRNLQGPWVPGSWQRGSRVVAYVGSFFGLSQWRKHETLPKFLHHVTEPGLWRCVESMWRVSVWDVGGGWWVAPRLSTHARLQLYRNKYVVFLVQFGTHCTQSAS